MSHIEQEPVNKSFLGLLRNFLNTPTPWYLFGVCFLSCLTIYLLFLYKKDFTFFPKPLKVSFYTDAVDHGNSKLKKVFSTDSVIGMECILQKGFMFPYAGFEISKDGKLINLSEYNGMEVEVFSKNVSHVLVYLNFKDKNVKDTLNPLALRRVMGELNVGGKIKTVKLPLQDFKTPDWWYRKVNQPKTDFEDPAFDKVKSIIFSTGVESAMDQETILKVYKITFYKNNTRIIFIMCLLPVFMWAFAFAFYFKKNRNKPELPLPKTFDVKYKAIEVKEPASKTDYSFLDYIHAHYMEPELSLTEISKAMGINQRIISDTISEKFGCNIKTYINQIRIAEAKRLLLETDLKVSEIAYMVGFNSPVNFNRVFKTFTGENPSEFVRKMKSDV